MLNKFANDSPLYCVHSLLPVSITHPLLTMSRRVGSAFANALGLSIVYTGLHLRIIGSSSPDQIMGSWGIPITVTKLELKVYHLKVYH